MSIPDFFETIGEDPRITPAHISVYLAMLTELGKVENSSFQILDRKKIMRMAKINARSTYDRIVHDLDAFGYIRYRPGKGKSSLIRFNKL